MVRRAWVWGDKRRGVRRLLISVDDDDEVNAGVWQERFGFQPLEVPELKQLGDAFAAFGAAEAAGTVFLAKTLSAAPAPAPPAAAATSGGPSQAPPRG
ncbi:hypothetical protein GPECTOR_51g686 [Gonium pectorale]|uniref:Uncharacterized protein n=1 Tax=Gonium pectorale TaxID=33097 RepID=A0A150G7A5_GONPE|nr:hypothetical protein GPECTOR_51g686 [Gonium pectorale]|eukprot:KXZ45701.1 hypothetical protein GPECTOR_51g686 [Gonium pectorale]